MPQSDGAWQDRAPQPGDAALGLLAPEWTVGIVGELADGQLRPAELKQRLPDAPHATLIGRLADLARAEIVVREDVAGRPRRVEYALTERGRELAEVVAEAARGERERPVGARERPAGERICRLIANRRGRAIARALAHGPVAQAEIERRLPGVSHSSLERRLRELVRAGAVDERPEPSSERALYEMSDYGRGLARLVLLAARWEWRWLDAWERPRSDIGGLVHTIAPLARIAPELEGACRLHVMEPAGEPLVDVSAVRGRISALALAPTVPIHAHARASAWEWGRGLLACDPGGIAIEGDGNLLRAVIVALGAGMLQRG